MKNRIINLFLIILSILVQRLLFETINVNLYKFPFASSLMILENQTVNSLLILYSFIPIPFMLFEFSGVSEELTKGYGKIFIIRSYKREVLIVKTIAKFAIYLIIIVLYQTSLFYLSSNKWQSISTIQYIYLIITYYFGLFAVILLQFYFELLIGVNYSNILTNVYFLGSLFIGNIILTSKEFDSLYIIFFPNTLFGSRNGIIHQTNVFIKHECVLIFLFIIIFILILLSVLKFRKKDIF